jgi:hypothetical protein
MEVSMKLRHLFMVNIFFAAFFGLSCTFLPGFVFRLYGLVPDDAAIWVTRLVGGSILGYGTLMWFGTRTASGEARRAIALALLIQDGIGCIASIIFQLTGKTNVFGWLSIGLYAFLALAYAFFLFVRPQDR